MSEQNNIPPQNSTMAVISLIAGILGWTLVPFFGALIAVVTGHMAKREIRESNGRLAGDGLATIGLVLGYASLGLTVLGVCLFIVIFVFGISIPFCMIPFANDLGFLLAPLLGN